MQPLLSVIIPLYNTANYVERCIDSIIGQSFKDIEIIVINDASTDNSLEVMNNYCNKFNNINLLNLPYNKGAGNARNIGIKMAKGKYIGFIDSDDWIDSNMYKIMIDSLEKNNCEIAICGVKNEYNNINCSNLRYNYTYENVINNSLALRLMCRSINSDIFISPVVWNKIFIKELITNNNISFLTDSCCEDNIFTFFSFVFAKNIVLVPNVYYHYYQRSDSITHSFTENIIDDLINLFIAIRNNLINYQLFDKYKEEYLSFFEKCITFTLSMLFKSETDIKIQKIYIKHLFNSFLLHFPDMDIVEYLDIQRIKRFFCLENDYNK